MESVEIIGYIGLALIAVSFFFAKMRVLRLFNLGGAVFMSVYGYMIESYPVAVLNVIIVIVNIYYLDKLSRANSKFDLLHIQYKPEDAFDKFFQEYEKDIKAYHPDIEKVNLSGCEVYLILREMSIAGAFIVEIRDETAHVRMDYVAPQFRDFANSEFLFTALEPEFRHREIQRLYCRSINELHQKYLQKTGFERVDEGAYVRLIPQS